MCLSSARKVGHVKMSCFEICDRCTSFMAQSIEIPSVSLPWSVSREVYKRCGSRKL
jgi:hypothetical protein